MPEIHYFLFLENENDMCDEPARPGDPAMTNLTTDFKKRKNLDLKDGPNTYPYILFCGSNRLI